MRIQSASPLWRESIMVFLGGALYWGLATEFSFVSEPWDASLYWPVLYPVSVAAAGVLGATTAWRPVTIGLGLTLPQVLIVALNIGATPALLIGLSFAVALSVPAVLVAWWAAVWFKRH